MVFITLQDNVGNGIYNYLQKYTYINGLNESSRGKSKQTQWVITYTQLKTGAAMNI